jgi:hypothetical protein
MRLGVCLFVVAFLAACGAGGGGTSIAPHIASGSVGAAGAAADPTSTPSPLCTVAPIIGDPNVPTPPPLWQPCGGFSVTTVTVLPPSVGPTVISLPNPTP